LLGLSDNGHPTTRRLAIFAVFVLFECQRLAPRYGLSVLDEQAAAFHAERGAATGQTRGQTWQESTHRHFPAPFVNLNLERPATHAHGLRTAGQRFSGDLSPGQRQAQLSRPLRRQSQLIR
jgi:hypothetical protein